MGFAHDASKRGVSSEHEIDMAPTFVSVRRHGGLRRQKARATHGIPARSRSSGRATGGSTIELVFDLMALYDEKVHLAPSHVVDATRAHPFDIVAS